jgi:transposase
VEQKRKTYTSEFKAEAVRLAEQDDVTAAQVARDLGIRPELLYRWTSQFGKKPDGKPSVTPEEHDELIRLRRDLKRVEMERDILKKAIGIFTKELP